MLAEDLRTMFEYLDRSCGYWCFATPRMDDRQDYFDPLDEALDRIKARLDAMED